MLEIFGNVLGLVGPCVSVGLWVVVVCVGVDGEKDTTSVGV